MCCAIAAFILAGIAADRGRWLTTLQWRSRRRLAASLTVLAVMAGLAGISAEHLSSITARAADGLRVRYSGD
jgi:hypothetical protein